MSVKKIKVLIADDHPMIRVGIRRILAKDPDIEVVGEAGDGEEVLRQIKQLQPDVLLLDYEMPKSNGIEIVAELRRMSFPVKVIIISVYDTMGFVRPLLNTGISGYLSKRDVSDHVVTAVREVSAGSESWLSPTITQEISDWERKTKRKVYYSRSSQKNIEQEVLTNDPKAGPDPNKVE